MITDFFGQENQLEKDINDNTRLLDELSANKTEIEHTNNVMLGRELKMIDLKKEIDELRAELSHKKGKKMTSDVVKDDHLRQNVDFIQPTIDLQARARETF